MLRALEEYVVEGPTTLLGFHRALLDAPCFAAGETCRGVVESQELAQKAKELDDQLSHPPTSVRPAADGHVGTRERVASVELDGRRHEVRIQVPAPAWAELARRHRERTRGLAGGGTDAVVSPMQGTVLAVEVEEGEAVEAGRVLCVIEAMKMENEIVAHRDGVVTGLAVQPGQAIGNGEPICLLVPGTA
jgi:acetyl-CoA/propionyl-CoA carboxylase biotin carboxyl carrier protein